MIKEDLSVESCSNSEYWINSVCKRLNVTALFSLVINLNEIFPINLNEIFP